MQRRINLLLALFVATCPLWCETNNRKPAFRIFAPATTERQTPPLNHVDDHDCLCCKGTIQPAVIDARPVLTLTELMPLPVDLGFHACFGEWIDLGHDRPWSVPPDHGRSALHCALLESFRC